MRLVAKRAIIYGLALFLGLEAIFALLEGYGFPKNWQTATIALLIALITTILVSVMDIRGKIQY
jgi:hypothetical protein